MSMPADVIMYDCFRQTYSEYKHTVVVALNIEHLYDKDQGSY